MDNQHCDGSTTKCSSNCGSIFPSQQLMVPPAHLPIPIPLLQFPFSLPLIFRQFHLWWAMNLQQSQPANGNKQKKKMNKLSKLSIESILGKEEEKEEEENGQHSSPQPNNNKSAFGEVPSNANPQIALLQSLSSSSSSTTSTSLMPSASGDHNHCPSLAALAFPSQIQTPVNLLKFCQKMGNSLDANLDTKTRNEVPKRMAKKEDDDGQSSTAAGERKRPKVCFGLTTEEKVQIQENEQQGETAHGFPCHRCGKVFSYEYYRDKHLKFTPCVDNGQRRFPCPKCQRSFEKRDRLRIHILHVHENHRPHSCRLCGKAFSQSSSLNKHLRTHSGERPYGCPHCEKRFTASSILRTHIRQHSGEKPFKCSKCGKCFASHAAHDSHLRRTHPPQ